jgi:hypothetical protein
MSLSAPVHLEFCRRPTPANESGADIISLDSFRQRRLAVLEASSPSTRKKRRLRLILGVALLALFDAAIILSVTRAPAPQRPPAAAIHR